MEARAQPSGHTLIWISGALEPGDGLKFRELTSEVSRATVFLVSPGGSVRAAKEIGTRVRLRRFDTVVPSKALCASACGLVWLAGVKRFIAPSARIGFHAAYRTDDEQKRESSAGNAVVGAYLNELGLPESAIIFITERPPHAMNWLNDILARKHEIDFEPYDYIFDLAWASLNAGSQTVPIVPRRPLNEPDGTGSIPRAPHQPSPTAPILPQSPSVTPEHMIRFVVGAHNSIERAMQFYSWPWDEKVRYIKGVGGQYTKTCFRSGVCIHQTDALTSNRKYGYAVRSNSRTDEKAYCVTSFERGRKACYTEGSGDVVFFYSSGGEWKKVAHTRALSMID
jgi:hypothetical protein